MLIVRRLKLVSIKKGFSIIIKIVKVIIKRQLYLVLKILLNHRRN
nr:MAG TPA: hypothetical protein [Caudoviricetes sp.]